ncbi:MAG TPA: carboxymuconolactone decarboxylase family protein [Holophagaceae bacterium]|nr:carboxymuconolactone decarboxylase family protein [Holophagaceae bacterium]
MRLSRPYPDIAPALFEAQLALSKTIGATGIDPKLRELLDLRISQLNGCAYCADMHAAGLLKRQESPRRLATLAAWRDTDFFTPKERAALAWAEALTKLTAHPDMDPVFEALKPHFSEAEIVALTFVILCINGWNRLGVGFRLDLPEQP